MMVWNVKRSSGFHVEFLRKNQIKSKRIGGYVTRIMIGKKSPVLVRDFTMPTNAAT